jgi:hypothetical protein
MTHSAFHCQASDHAGERIVRDPSKQVIVSEDHMLSNGSRRIHRIQLMNLCRVCSDKREQRLRPKGPKTIAMFGEHV